MDQIQNLVKQNSEVFKGEVTKPTEVAVVKTDFKLYLNSFITKINDRVRETIIAPVNWIRKFRVWVVEVSRSKPVKEQVGDLSDAAKFVIIHGGLGVAVLMTFFGFRFEWLYLIGSGAAYYLLLDFLKFVFDSVSQMRGSMKNEKK